jgi:hypothetical protein
LKPIPKRHPERSEGSPFTRFFAALRMTLTRFFASLRMALT